MRNFQNKKEMVNITNISGNLQTMAKELEEAQDKSEKLSKKGGKAKADKVGAHGCQARIATALTEVGFPGAAPGAGEAGSYNADFGTQAQLSFQIACTADYFLCYLLKSLLQTMTCFGDIYYL